MPKGTIIILELYFAKVLGLGRIQNLNNKNMQSLYSINY